MTRLLEILPAQDILGEGPVWDAEAQTLWWTDIQGRRLRHLTLSTGRLGIVPAHERIGSFALIEGRPDAVLAAFETGVGVMSLKSGDIDWIGRPEVLGSGRRFNDGRTDRQGRFWVSTMVEAEDRAGPASAALWRLDAEGELVHQEGGVMIGNGLATSPDGKTLYFADSPRQRLYRYRLDPDDGVITGKEVFVEVEHGYPDGGAVDAEGALWSARWGAGEVVRHAPDGRILERIKTPASQPTCVAFGGPDMRHLFITSAKDGLTDSELAEQPSAGDLFIYESDVPGLTDVKYRNLRTAKLD